MIAASFGIRRIAADNRFIRRHFWQLQLFHQAVHSSDTDVYAIITLKDICDFVSAEPLVVISIDMKNERSNILIFFNTRRGFGRKMLVIGTPVYSENLAQYLNAMLEAELMYSV